MRQLNPDHVWKLLQTSTPGPWGYDVIKRKEWEHAIFEYVDGGVVIAEDGFDSGKSIPDFELASLAPQLAQEWLIMRMQLNVWRSELKKDLDSDYARIRYGARTEIEGAIRILGRVLGDDND